MDYVIEIIRDGGWGAVAVCPIRGQEWRWPGKRTALGDSHWLGYYTTKCPVCKDVAVWKSQNSVKNHANTTTVRIDELAAHLGFPIVHPDDVNQADIDAALAELQAWVS